jgi:hypothetical protein
MTAAETSYLDGSRVEYLEDGEQRGGDIPPETPGADDSGPTSFLVTDDDDKDADFLKAPPRPRGAVTYEKKIKKSLFAWMHIAIHNPETAPDAAAIIKFGQDVAEKGGDLAATNKNFRKAVEFLDGGVSNPTIAFVAAAGVLALQILRNHEPVAETPPKRHLRIPFTKRTIGLRFNIKLGRLRSATQDPPRLTHGIFSDPDVQAKLLKYHGIRLVGE